MDMDMDIDTSSLTIDVRNCDGTVGSDGWGATVNTRSSDGDSSRGCPYYNLGMRNADSNTPH